MKVKLYGFLGILLMTISSCSKDEITLNTTDFAFVHKNGSAILAGECISSADNYAVSITTKAEGSGAFKAKKIEYTVNGATYNATFTAAGTLLNNIILRDGLNILQISESGASVSLYYYSHDEFVLVE
jgi:hypothetical protein